MSTKIMRIEDEKFGKLDSKGKPIAMLGDGRWPQAAKPEGGKTSRTARRNNVMSVELLEVSLKGVGTVARLERHGWPMVE